ncbi:type II toxin-antitoxin system RelE family toxin [Nesterenkonia lutea]|uniref:type II toxin-antitoxin system RelE family toxin n=1 Tax=Nesterenkonia lutea TaxID=272919 RepID=UPI001789D81A
MSSTWRIELDADVRKVLKKLDKSVTQQILRKLREVESLDDPTSMGKPLLPNCKGFCVHRVGHYQVVCDIQRGELWVLATELRQRSDGCKIVTQPPPGPQCFFVR